MSENTPFGNSTNTSILALRTNFLLHNLKERGSPFDWKWSQILRSNNSFVKKVLCNETVVQYLPFKLMNFGKSKHFLALPFKDNSFYVMISDLLELSSHCSLNPQTKYVGFLTHTKSSSGYMKEKKITLQKLHLVLNNLLTLLPKNLLLRKWRK